MRSVFSGVPIAQYVRQQSSKTWEEHNKRLAVNTAALRIDVVEFAPVSGDILHAHITNAKIALTLEIEESYHFNVSEWTEHCQKLRAVHDKLIVNTSLQFRELHAIDSCCLV